MDDTGEGERFIRIQTYILKPIFKSQLKAPDHEILTISGQDSDEEATQKVRETLRRVAEGKIGKKVLFRLEDVKA